MSVLQLVLDNVKAHQVPPPYPVSGGRFRSVVWSESDKIWSGTLVIRLGKFYREVLLRESDSGQFFAHTFIPRHSIDLSVLDSHEHFVTLFSDGEQQVMHLGLEFGSSIDALNFYRALLCQEEEGETATIENVDDYDVGEVEVDVTATVENMDDYEEEGEGEKSTRDEEEEEAGESARGDDEEEAGESARGDDEEEAGESARRDDEEEAGESALAETTGDESARGVDEEEVEGERDDEEEAGESARAETTGDESARGVDEEETGKDVMLGQLSAFKKQVNNVYDELKEKKRELEKKDRELKVKDDKLDRLEREKLELQQQNTVLKEGNDAKANQIKKLVQQISALKEESAAQMKELEKTQCDTMIQMLTGIQEKEKEIRTKINENLSEWRTKSAAL